MVWSEAQYPQIHCRDMTEPRNFSWFVEGLLAGMAYPKDSDISFLAEAGVKALVNLTPDDYYSETAKELGIKVHSLRVPCFSPPSEEDIKKFVAIVDAARDQKEAVGIHCAMGRGRTGTMLACYLVAREGYGADEAIAETRRRRKLSVETRTQEQAVRDFAQSLREENT